MKPLDPNSARIEPDISRATTLSAPWYVRPDALALERERIFARTWQQVGHLGKVEQPGDFFTCEVGGAPIVVLRDSSQTLKAFYNVCRHRGGPVAQGEGNIKALKCAYHGWLYGLDGNLRVTPEFQGVQCFDRESHGLKCVAVDSWGPFVFVNLAGDGASPSLQETLGKIPDETSSWPLRRMGFHKRVVYELKCNWKVYVDNYLEGYHIPQIHPGLLRELDYPQYKTEVERYYSKQHAPIRNRDDSLYKRSLAEGALPTALYYWVFPNLMLNIYPDNIQINVIVPIDHERTATIFDWYFLDANRSSVTDDFAKSLAFSDLVQKEDIFICEAVQKGLASKAYDHGRYSVQRETGVHHFHRLIGEFLTKE